MKRPDRLLVPPERLIERSQLLDAIADDDDIKWKTDPFEMRPESANPETPDEIIAMITFAGSPELQEQLRSLCKEYIDIFSTSVRSLPAQVDPMVIEIDRTKWEVPRNRLPPRHHSAEKQAAIRTQVNKLLELGVIEESQASEWRQAHPVPKGDGQWRLTLNFVQLNAAAKGLEGWPIPNILETLTRLGTMKPTCFGLLDFTAGYHQTPLDPASQVLTAFRAAGGLYQWTRVAMGLKGCLAVGRSTRDSGPAHPIRVGAAHGPRGNATFDLGPPGQPSGWSMTRENGCRSRRPTHTPTGTARGHVDQLPGPG